MKVRYHVWSAVRFYPPEEAKNDPWSDSCELHREHVEVPDNPTDHDLIRGWEMLLCEWENPEDIPVEDWSPAVESDEDGRLFWEFAEGQHTALYVEFLREDDIEECNRLQKENAT